LNIQRIHASDRVEEYFHRHQEQQTQTSFVVILINPKHVLETTQSYVERLLTIHLDVLGYEGKNGKKSEQQSHPVCFCFLLNFRDVARTDFPNVQELENCVDAVLQDRGVPKEKIVADWINVSLLNCYGLDRLHTFIYKAYLLRKQAILQEHLSAVQNQMKVTFASDTSFTSYENFVHKVAPQPGEKSPSPVSNEPEDEGEQKSRRKIHPTTKSSKRGDALPSDGTSKRDENAPGRRETPQRILLHCKKELQKQKQQKPASRMGKDALEAFLASSSDEEVAKPSRRNERRIAPSSESDDDDDDDFFYDEKGLRKYNHQAPPSQMYQSDSSSESNDDNPRQAQPQHHHHFPMSQASTTVNEKDKESESESQSQQSENVAEQTSPSKHGNTSTDRVKESTGKAMKMPSDRSVPRDDIHDTSSAEKESASSMETDAETKASPAVETSKPIDDSSAHSSDEEELSRCQERVHADDVDVGIADEGSVGDSKPIEAATLDWDSTQEDARDVRAAASPSQEDSAAEEKSSNIGSVPARKGENDSRDYSVGEASRSEVEDDSDGDYMIDATVPSVDQCEIDSGEDDYPIETAQAEESKDDETQEAVRNGANLSRRSLEQIEDLGTGVASARKPQPANTYVYGSDDDDDGYVIGENTESIQITNSVDSDAESTLSDPHRIATGLGKTNANFQLASAQKSSNDHSSARKTPAGGGLSSAAMAAVLAAQQEAELMLQRQQQEQNSSLYPADTVRKRSKKSKKKKSGKEKKKKKKAHDEVSE
jgi:hypothetical protein